MRPEPTRTYTWTHAVDEGELPDGREDRALTLYLLHPVQDCLAPTMVQLRVAPPTPRGSPTYGSMDALFRNGKSSIEFER
jgi:hypothetical protein